MKYKRSCYKFMFMFNSNELSELAKHFTINNNNVMDKKKKSC